jgi:hypothetical protein
VPGASLGSRAERAPRPSRPPLDEAAIAAHITFVGSLGGSPIWAEYVAQAPPEANAA